MKRMWKRAPEDIRYGSCYIDEGWWELGKVDELLDREMEKFDTFLGQSVVDEVCFLADPVEFITELFSVMWNMELDVVKRNMCVFGCGQIW